MMISFDLRPFISFLMMGVFFSLFRVFLNFIHQTNSSKAEPARQCQPGDQTLKCVAFGADSNACNGV